ncbi:MAG: hypothetical protein KA981_01625 [Bacteroidia bacterium]|jgi:hypothetical protein|nr:hypothetical protein [Bacteroidia bacterium]
MKPKTLTLSLLLLLSSITSFSQPGFEDDVEDTPISGISELILTSGVLIGLWNLKPASRENLKN